MVLTGDGPDGSSIKPVSSLLARFENMSATAQPQPHEPALPPMPPMRPISPAPKPDRLRTFKPYHEGVSVQPKSPCKTPTKLQDRPAPADGHGPASPAPPSKSSPAHKLQGLAILPPSVTVQPPLSSQKGRVSSVDSGSQSSFLDPVSAVLHDTHGGPPNQIKLPSRPLSPLLSMAAPKSPRPGLSNQPSPPPPRRSAEVRREKEVRQIPPSPPPAPRTGRSGGARPQPASLPEARENGLSSRAWIPQETSPFRSPLSSSGEGEGETRPQLPMRPRPRVQSDAPDRVKPDLSGLDPPPVHPSIAIKRLERKKASSSPTRAPVTPHRTAEHRPVYSSKPPVPDAAQPRALHDQIAEVPRRPPRSAPQGASANAKANIPPPPSNRCVSEPATRQFPALPTRQDVNSKPRDRTPERARGAETNHAPSPVVVTTKAPLPTSVPEPAAPSLVGLVSAYPDGANANRRPPFIKKGFHEIQTRYEARAMDVCGELVCTSGQLTRVWNLLDGEQVMSLAHTEGARATAVAFKPAPSADVEGSVLWIGTNLGEIMEVEVSTQRILLCRGAVHERCDVIRIYRHVNELWTFDEAGTIHVWGPGADGVPSLSGHPHQSNKLPKGHTFSMVVKDELWHAAGKAIRVFSPSLDASRPFQVLVRPLKAEGAGDVTAGTQTKTHPGKAFFGHIDGKVSVFSTVDYSCVAVLSISAWKINALAGVGHQMWVGYNTGKMCVYDMMHSPWVVKKDWQAHDQSVMRMVADAASAYRLDRVQVITLGADNKVKAWDGLLQDDWLEDDIKSKDVQYCDFDEIRAMVMTWNAGASTPHSLRYSGADATFFQDLVQSSGSPDILVFGFQELVDLEDKKATAKRFLKSSKKKEGGTDQERMSHQYRDWRDFLMKTLDDHMPSHDLYHLLHSAPLVGLFTCVFVKASLRERIRNLGAAEVKRGMGGLHGNKGAVVVRFQVDDTSLCFINCHLAAGQAQSSSRHNDVAAILETTMFPAERDAAVRIDNFTGGGDGSMVLDHELCVLNGDLNYRIDTMSRDTVIKAVQQQNLTKLLERDQLLMARRRNPAFRLRAFDEMGITFAPTYKYDVGTDTYDTSEKRRSPAWCDRLLYRGRGRVQQLDYRRHEVRVSDHRPVTGSFRLWVKKVKVRERAVAWIDSQQAFEDLRQRETAEAQFFYLVDTCGYDEQSSRQFVHGRAGITAHRSGS